MSASDSPFPVKERNPMLPRYNVPRVVLDEEGYEVMDDLRTDDLPLGPPNDANFARKRLLVVACCVMLLATAVAFIVCAIVENPSAFFGHRYAAVLDDTTHEAVRTKEAGSSSNTTWADKANASLYPIVHHMTGAFDDNVSVSFLSEDADAITLLASIEATEVPATGGSKVS